MADRTVGNIIVEGWTVFDLAGAPLTGMTSPAHVTLTLVRQSGSTMVAAAEAITWTEIGVTGRYYFSFTPLYSGLYVVYGLEISALTLCRAFEFRYDVRAAGATFAATYANAYCAETDIERWIQTLIDATTSPDDTEAAAFAESRASVLSSLCSGWGYSVTPATITAGSRLEDMLREANAIGAALDYTVAQQFSNRPSTSNRVERFQQLWIDYVGDPGNKNAKAGFIENEIKGSLVSLASDHIISGDTVAYDEGAAPTSVAIGITMGDLF
jgi:hypothetical protein